MRSRVACLVVGAVALTAGVATGCGGGGDDTGSDAQTPEEAVQQFFDASASEDGAAACEVLSQESQDQAIKEAEDADDCEGAFQEDADAGNIDIPEDVEVGEATIDGDTGTVAVTSQGQSVDFPVVQEDGQWKLDLVGIGG